MLLRRMNEHRETGKLHPITVGKSNQNTLAVEVMVFKIGCRIAEADYVMLHRYHITIESSAAPTIKGNKPPQSLYLFGAGDDGPARGARVS